MKTGISATIDYECVVWLNNQKGKKSRVINRLIQAAMAGEKDTIADLEEQLRIARGAIKQYMKLQDEEWAKEDDSQ